MNSERRENCFLTYIMYICACRKKSYKEDDKVKVFINKYIDSNKHNKYDKMTDEIEFVQSIWIEGSKMANGQHFNRN